MISQTSFSVKICWWELAIAVRVLGLVFVKKTTSFLDQVDGALLASDLTVLGCQHGHLIGVLVLTAIVVNHGFHRLLIVLATIIAVDWVTLEVYPAWALAEFSANLEPLLNLFFVKAGCTIMRLHFREAAALGTGL